jgi:ATP-dependent helicase/nuclease subunit B
MSQHQHTLSLLDDLTGDASAAARGEAGSQPRITLRFLGWDRPALPAAGDVLMDRYRGVEAADLSAATIVLPGRRPGRRLKELLLDRAEALDLRLVPPRIVAIGDLPELLHPPERPRADAVLARRAWARALREAPAERLAEVYPRRPEPGDLRGWETLAAEVHRLHGEVGGGGLRVRQVAAVCRDAGSELLFDDAARWEALAGVQERYAAILSEIGRSDRELARLEALRTEREVAFRGDLWLVGIAEMPRIVRLLLRSAGVAIHVLVHAPEGEGVAFDELGCLRVEAWTERRLEIPDDRIRIADRPADQADAAVAEIARLGERYATDDVVIAVPDAELVPSLEQRLEGREVPARYAGGRPADRFAPHRLLAALADYLSGRRWEAFAALIRHPDLAAWLARATGQSEAAILGAADRWYADRLPASLPRSVAGGSRAARVVGAVIEVLESGDGSLLAGMAGRRPLSRWPAAILPALAKVYEGRTLSRDRPRDRALLAALQGLRDAAASLHRLPDALDEETDAATAMRLLLDAVQGQSVPEEPEEAAVELLGWLELPLDDAPVVVVTGVHEPHLPEAVSADAFLPDALRRRLGMLDNAGRYARDAYHLTALLHSRQRVTLVAGRRDGEGNPLRPSRLLLALEGEALARRVRRLSEGEGEMPALPARRRPAVTSAFRLPPSPVVEHAPPDRISVTAFRAILADPYRFALERLLGLEEVADTAREMDGGAFGSLAHEVLQQWGAAELAAPSSDPGSIRDTLDETLDREVAKRFGRDPLPAVRIQAEHLRARLHRFADWQAARATEGWRIAHVEGGASVTTTLEVDGEPITLSGRIDRIDHHPPSGAWQILDYKTGDRATDPEKAHRKGRTPPREWVDLQLPLYRELLPEIRGADGSSLIPPHAMEAVEYGFILLPRDLEAVGCALADWGAADLDEAVEVARDCVRMIRSGRYEFDPDRSAPFESGGLAALLGRRQLLGAADDEAEEGEE